MMSVQWQEHLYNSKGKKLTDSTGIECYKSEREYKPYPSLWNNWVLYLAVDAQLVLLVLLPKEKYHHPKDKTVLYMIICLLSCTQLSSVLYSNVHHTTAT